MRIALIIIFSLFFQNTCTPQGLKFEWVKGFGKYNKEDGSFLVVDSTENIYIAQSFINSIDVNPDLDSFNLKSNGSKDIAITKLNSEGKFVWAKRIGGKFDDKIYSITADNIGNIYLLGSFEDSVDFDPGPDKFNLYSSYKDIFVLKIDKEGNFIWAKQFKGEPSNNSIVLDQYDNLIITYNFRKITDCDPSEDLYNLTSSDYQDVAIIKLDKHSNFVWAKQISNGWNEVKGIAVDTKNSVHITGFFQGEVNFDPGVIDYKLRYKGNRDAFILKLGDDGRFIWAKQFGGKGEATGNSLTIDNQGNVYSVGNFKGSIDFDPNGGEVFRNWVGQDDIYIVKLDEDGSLVWVKQWGSPNYDNGKNILLDRSNLYVTGSFGEVAYFNPGDITHELTSAGISDILLTILDTNGDLKWCRQIGGVSEENIFSMICVKNNIYLLGFYSDTVDFDPDTPNSTLTATEQFTHLFICKFSQNTTGITEDFLKEPIPAFPNPTSDKIIIVNPFKTEQNIHIKIYTLEGNLLKEFSLMSQAKLHIDLGDQPQGAYILKLTSGSESFMAKVNVVK